MQVTLSGEPPFRLHYQLAYTDEHKRSKTTKHVKTITQLREEIIFQPEQVGQYTWEAIKLEDAAYVGKKAVDLPKGVYKSSTQVHPLASVAWRKPGSDDVRSCQGKTITTEIELTVSQFKLSSFGKC